MKKKHVIRLVCFVLVALFLSYFTMVFMRVNNARDCLGLYGFEFEEKDSIDVALMGPSQIYTSYYAPLAYKEYGYTSYAISVSSMLGSTYITAFKQIREKQNPKLYIVELSGFYYEDQRDDARLRKYLDNIPLYSDYRLEAIEKLVPEDLRYSYYLPFMKYHDNFEHLRSCIGVMVDKIKIRTRGYSLFKNFSTTNGICDVKSKEINKYTRTKVNDESFEAFYELVDFLKEENINNVLFVNMPDACVYDNNDSYLKLKEEVKNCGFDYVDFHSDEMMNDIGIDFKNDFYNVNHLNINGVEKMTKYFGNYIVNNYDVKSEHTEKVTKQWEDCSSIVDKVIEIQKKRLEKDNDNKVRQNMFESEFFKDKN